MMSKIVEEVTSAIADYVTSFGDKEGLLIPPGRQFTILISDQGKSLLADIQRIRNNSMVPSDIPIYGYIYNYKSGRLIEVPEAIEAGKVN
jgi:hypothetical protein